MSALGSLFGSKPKDYVIRPGEYAELYRQERQGNTPNVNNMFGSSETVWDGDQATVTQTMSPELQSIAQQLMGHVGQGPAQMGEYSSPLIQGLLGNMAQSMSGRMGAQAPPMNMGGYQQPQQMPTAYPNQEMQQPTLPAQTLPANPQQQTGQPVGGGHMMGDWYMQNPMAAQQYQWSR